MPAFSLETIKATVKVKLLRHCEAVFSRGNLYK